MTASLDESDRVRDPLPADFICPACGYDLSGAAVERCSECGLEINQAVIDADQRRREYLQGRWQGDLWLGVSPIAAIVVLSLLADSVGQVFIRPALIGGAILGGVAITPGIIASAICVPAVARGFRKSWFCSLVGMQAVAQLPLVAFGVTGLVGVTVGLVVEIGDVLGFILPAVGMLAGFIALALFWTPMWRRAGARAGLIQTPIMRRRVHLISIVSALPGLLLMLLLILATILVILSQ